MHQLLERLMTKEERQRLLECMPLASSPFRPFRRYQYGLEVIGELFGVLVMASIFMGLGKLPAVYVIPTALGLLAIWWVLHLKRRVLTPLRRYREANQRVWDFRNAVNAAQTIRVHCVESDLVVQMMHDEGTICLFDVGRIQTYWIAPILLIPGRSPKTWPNRSFE